MFFAAMVVSALVGDSEGVVVTIWGFVGLASGLACWALSLVIWILRGKHGPRNIPSLVILSSFGFLFGWIYIFFRAGDLEEIEKKARLRASLTARGSDSTAAPERLPSPSPTPPPS